MSRADCIECEIAGKIAVGWHELIEMPCGSVLWQAGKIPRGRGNFVGFLLH